jgi:hypothetical protein
MSKVNVVEIWRQPIEINGIQLFNVIIPTTRVEITVAPNINSIRGGILIRSTMNLGHALEGVSGGRNLNKSSRLPITTTGVVGTPQMVVTNLIMTTRK